MKYARDVMGLIPTTQFKNHGLSKYSELQSTQQPMPNLVCTNPSNSKEASTIESLIGNDVSTEAVLSSQNSAVKQVSLICIARM